MRSLKTTLYTLLTLLLVGCSGPKMIPEPVLRDILRDAFISQAAATRSDYARQKGVAVDTMDMHTPILKRYGYTLDDMRYTVRQMSVRKSNPLPNILEIVSADIKSVSQVAQARYLVKLKLDTLARNFSADTIYRRDTTITGRIDGLKWTILPLAGDTALQVGNYQIMFDYSTGRSTGAFSKTLQYTRVMDSLRKDNNSMWLSRVKDTVKFERSITIAKPDVKRMEFLFKESKPPKGQIADTVYLKNIRVVHTLPKAEANKVFYIYKSGLIPIEDRIETALYKQRLRELEAIDSTALKLEPCPDTTKRYFQIPYQALKATQERPQPNHPAPPKI